MSNNVVDNKKNDDDDKKLFIFDLDDTLYNINSHYEMITANKQLIEKLIGDKIIFSNASYLHCLLYLKRMEILDIFKCIISSDIINGGKKPNPFIYGNLTKLCNTKSYDDIYYFDDIIENLYIGHLFGWKTIWINNNHSILTINYDYLKHFIPAEFLVEKDKMCNIDNWLYGKFHNINDALKAL